MKYDKAITTDGNQVDLQGLTVLVGPNNSGKSTTLRDIYTYITGDRSREPILIQQLVSDTPPTQQQLYTESKKYTADDRLYQGIAPNLREIAQFNADEPVLNAWINTALASGNPQYWQNFGKFQVARLDVESRLELAKATPSHDVAHERPSKILQMLYCNETVQSQLNQAFSKTFGQQIKYDYTSLKKLYLRVAPDFNDVPERTERRQRRAHQKTRIRFTGRWHAEFHSSRSQRPVGPGSADAAR